MFQILMTKFLVARTIPATNVFFSQVPDVAKETKFIVSVNEFADEELEARKLGYLCCN